MEISFCSWHNELVSVTFFYWIEPKEVVNSEVLPQKQELVDPSPNVPPPLHKCAFNQTVFGVWFFLSYWCYNISCGYTEFREVCWLFVVIFVAIYFITHIFFVERKQNSLFKDYVLFYYDNFFSNMFQVKLLLFFVGFFLFCFFFCILCLFFWSLWIKIL